MTKTKKIIVFVFITIVVGFMLALFFRPHPPREKTKVLPTPNIPRAIKGDYEIVFTVPESAFNFPQKATIDTKKAPLLGEGEIKILASRLGLNEGPIVAEDIIDGTVHIYRSEVAGLASYLDRGLLNYTLNTLPSPRGTALKEGDIKNLAIKFLVDGGFVEEGKVTFSSFLFLKDRSGEGLSEVPKEEATIYQANFTPGNLGLPLISASPKAPPIYVQLAPNGDVFAAKVQRLSVSKGITEYSLKNFSEVKSALPEAVLVSLDDGNIHLSDLPEGAVKRVEIKGLELAYFADTTDNLLPVFLLKGSATVSGEEGEISAWLYLPALSASYP